MVVNEEDHRSILINNFYRQKDCDARKVIKEFPAKTWKKIAGNFIQEAQLMLTNLCDAFRGQSRSSNIVLFHMSSIVSSCAIVTLSLRRAVCFWYLTSKMPWPWKPGYGSVKAIGNDTIRSDTHNFLLTFHSNYRPMSHHFREKRRFPSKIANFPTPAYL